MTAGIKRFTIIALLVTTTSACGSECDFRERCAGNVREVCGAVDEVLRVERYPCEAPSPLCIAIDDQTAQCVTDPPTTCDESTFVAACEGDLLRVCRGAEYLESPSYPTHYIVATDCAAEGKTCTIADDLAACR